MPKICTLTRLVLQSNDIMVRMRRIVAEHGLNIKSADVVKALSHLDINLIMFVHKKSSPSRPTHPSIQKIAHLTWESLSKLPGATEMGKSPWWNQPWKDEMQGSSETVMRNVDTTSLSSQDLARIGVILCGTVPFCFYKFGVMTPHNLFETHCS